MNVNTLPKSVFNKNLYRAKVWNGDHRRKSDPRQHLSFRRMLTKFRWKKRMLTVADLTAADTA
jgi:hypothetical protein